MTSLEEHAAILIPLLAIIIGVLITALSRITWVKIENLDKKLDQSVGTLDKKLDRALSEHHNCQSTLHERFAGKDETKEIWDAFTTHRHNKEGGRVIR